MVKKTVLSEFDSPRTGLIGITLGEGDEVVNACLTDGNQEVILVTRRGQAIRFREEETRPMGRIARGVHGVALEDGDLVVAMDVVRPDGDLLVTSELGFGKRTPLSEYRITGRGGKGIRTLNVAEKNGEIVGAVVVGEQDEVMIISSSGVMIRIAVADVPEQGRSTMGVRLMKLDEGQKVVTLALIAARDDEQASNR